MSRIRINASSKQDIVGLTKPRPVKVAPWIILPLHILNHYLHRFLGRAFLISYASQVSLGRGKVIIGAKPVLFVQGTSLWRQVFLTMSLLSYGFKVRARPATKKM